ncbi:Protoporphyrinogen oxidase [Rhodofomes roseus]|uniref:Protoporphyrinogen oxidase n=1 Tax=Rhodofomes roseus TaxID=34475 RepID=A0ABQ8KF54_9APHY|nr:Protoporphyrinogen oxidase [Rhodofomes roseus]KAH9836268.1 Protoporphyrinogen oxidase [Rhodofomes roseus]
MPPRHVAILGGGLTGLSSAFHISRRFPNTQITLLEKQNRLGGWVMSERVEVRVPSETGSSVRTARVLLESGPRTLRPGGQAVLELVNLLNLAPSLLTVPRTAPAALNRFLHLPGSPGLLRIPMSFASLLTSPLAPTLVRAVFKDAFSRGTSPPRAAEEEDESTDAFLTRHFGGTFARTFGSALIHGIYAADARDLSIRAAFPQMLEYEQAGGGSVIRGMIATALARRKDTGEVKEGTYELGGVEGLMQGMSVYSFKEGTGELVDALERDLEGKESVRVLKGDGAVSLGKGESGDGFEIRTASGTTLTPSHLVSSLPLPALNALLHSSSSRALPALPHLTANPTSSVTVVNIVFPGPPTSLHPPGFGYLVPRPASDYADGNALGILGTVFDSCALPTQDPADAPITKVTVMLGGPYYTRGRFAPPPVDGDGSLSSEYVRRLLDELSRHLGKQLPAPLLVRVRTHEACIPTPTPGHVARIAEMRRVVRESWGEAAEVIGAGVDGVSVPACVEAGRTVGRNW